MVGQVGGSETPYEVESCKKRKCMYHEGEHFKGY